MSKPFIHLLDQLLSSKKRPFSVCWPEKIRMQIRMHDRLRKKFINANGCINTCEKPQVKWNLNRNRFNSLRKAYKPVLIVVLSSNVSLKAKAVIFEKSDVLIFYLCLLRVLWVSDPETKFFYAAEEWETPFVERWIILYFSIIVKLQVGYLILTLWLKWSYTNNSG